MARRDRDKLEAVTTQRCRQFADALDRDRPADLRGAACATFAAEAILEPEGLRPGEMAQHGGWAVRLARQLGGLHLRRIAPAGPTVVMASADEGVPFASGEARITCEISPSAPHRILRWSHQSRPLARPTRYGDPSDQALVNRAVAVAANAGLFSGVVLLRRGGDESGAVVGVANLEAGEGNAMSTRFNTASLTKLFTAVAVCRLDELRLIALDAPISRWLRGAIPDSLAALTSHELLAHLGGLPEQVPWSDDQEIADDWLATLSAVSPDPSTRGRFAYSNAGYALLGAVVERVTGRTYFEAMSELVFRPLEMGSTGFEESRVAARGRAVGYEYASDEATTPTAPTLAAGLGRGAPYGYAFSTADDVERLTSAVSRLDIVARPHAAAILQGSIATVDPTRRAGYGMFRERHGRHWVTTSAGAGPGVSAWLDLIPELGLRVVVLANHPKPSAHRIGRFLRASLIAEAARGASSREVRRTAPFADRSSMAGDPFLLLGEVRSLNFL